MKVFLHFNLTHILSNFLQIIKIDSNGCYIVITLTPNQLRIVKIVNLNVEFKAAGIQTNDLLLYRSTTVALVLLWNN